MQGFLWAQSGCNISIWFPCAAFQRCTGPGQSQRANERPRAEALDPHCFQLKHTEHLCFLMAVLLRNALHWEGYLHCTGSRCGEGSPGTSRCSNAIGLLLSLLPLCWYFRRKAGEGAGQPIVTPPLFTALYFATKQWQRRFSASSPRFYPRLEPHCLSLPANSVIYWT